MDAPQLQTSNGEHPLITISGTPGSGTTTVASSLADLLGYDLVDAGKMFRELAAERNLDLNELLADAEATDRIDRSLDTRLQRIVQQHDFQATGLVMEARLAGWIAGGEALFKVWLDAPQDVRESRLEPLNESIPVAQREVREAARYKAHYDIDMYNTEIYDLVLNTARWGEQAVAELVIQALHKYSTRADEGTRKGSIDVKPL